MKPARLKSLMVVSALLLTVLLHGCGAWEQASVVVVYSEESEAEGRLLDSSNRQRIEDAFRVFTERNGYQCRPHVKRVEEIKCRGPQDLHLIFQPSMNRTEFVAQFSWVDSSGRTHEAFMRHVSKFKSELAAVAGVTDVRFESKT